MENREIKQRITQTLDHLNREQLVLVEKLLIKIKADFKTDKSSEIPSESTENTDDPLAQLRKSNFIGCFADEPDLAEKSEEIAQGILSKKETHRA